MSNKIKEYITLDLGIYFFGQFFNLISPLLVVPYIISVCGIKNFGKSSVALALVFFAIVIIDYGSDIIGVKQVATNIDKKSMLKNIFMTNMLARLLVLVLIILTLSIIFLLVPYFASEKALFYLTLTILIGQYMNPTWFLQGLGYFKLISILNILSKTSYVALIFLFIKEPSDYIYINLFLGLGMFFSFSFGILYCFKKDYIIFKKIKFHQIKTYLIEGFSFCVSQIFMSFKNYSPIVLIGYLGGFQAAGFFKIIEQILSVFRTYLQVIFKYLYPKVCFQIDKNFSDGFIFWKRANLANFIVLFCMLCMISIGSGLVLHFFGLKPQQILAMQPLLRFALFIPLFISIVYAFEQLLLSLAKNKIYIKITIITVVFNFFCMWFLFLQFNLLGLLIAIMITELIVILCYGFIVFMYLKKKSNES